MVGYVFQGRAYEGLTCNALEWLASFGAGAIVDDDGKITVSRERAVKAFATAATWIGTISPRAVLNYAEEESRAVFQAGNAVFLRNWPYVWALANAEGSPVKDKIGFTMLPRGGAQGQHRATLGGWAVAVSRYSKEPAAAADLVRFLTSEAEQRRRAIDGGFNPTRVALYDDPEIRRRHPFMVELKAFLAGSVIRPARITGGQYNRVSSEFWEAAHKTLAGKGSAAHNLAELGNTLERLQRRRPWRAADTP
jgi:trehalose/maltose transport system substrate-binding protein